MLERMTALMQQGKSGEPLRSGHPLFSCSCRCSQTLFLTLTSILMPMPTSTWT